VDRITGQIFRKYLFVYGKRNEMGTYDRQNVNPVARSVGAHPPSTWGSIPAT